MLVGLQVMSSKEGGRGGDLFDKILLAWTKSLFWPCGQPGITLGAKKVSSPDEPSPLWPSLEGPSMEGPSLGGQAQMVQAKTPKLIGSGSPLSSFRMKIEIKT